MVKKVWDWSVLVLPDSSDWEVQTTGLKESDWEVARSGPPDPLPA